MKHEPFFIIDLKPNLTIDDVVSFLNKMTENGSRTFRNFYTALPYHHLKEANAKFSDSGITFGASSLNSVEENNFAAPIAVSLVKNAGAKFALIGKKEEKALFKLTENDILKKLERALKENLPSILFIGESIEDFRKDQTETVLKEQLTSYQEAIKQELLTTIVYQMPFEALPEYLPSLKELEKCHTQCLNVAKEVLSEEELKKITWAVHTPIDIAGFSEIVDENPFNGFYFSKSGIFPHAIHEEASKLFHVHCTAEKSS